MKGLQTLPEQPFERMQLGSASVCATHPSLSLAFREYFQLSEKLNPRAFTAFIANSNTERRRWYRLHKRIIELSLYTKCHVLLVDDETGRTLGTLTSEELQGFARVCHHHAARAIVSHRHVCRLCRSIRSSTRGSVYCIPFMSRVAARIIWSAMSTRSPECGV